MPQIRFGIFRQSMENLGQIGRFDSKIFRLFTRDRHRAIRSKMASEIAKTFDLFTVCHARTYGTRQFKVRTRCMGNCNVPNCWFSHDFTKIQTKKLSTLPRFYFHDALEQLKTNFHTNFRFKGVLGFVIEYAWISKLLRDAAFTWRQRELSLFQEILQFK